MAQYSYQAINEIGNMISGVLEAESVNNAKIVLASKGYIPVKVTEELRAASESVWADIKSRIVPVKTEEIIIFTKQFKTMVRAGVPMLKLLQVLENQTANKTLKKVVGHMARDIKSGSSLYDAFKKHPHTFSSLYCSMVKAGEASGALAEVLDRLIYLIEHEHKMKSDIKAAIRYPVVVVIFLIIAFVVLLTFVIPKFVKIFTSSGIDIPVPTRMCIALYHFFHNYLFFVMGGVILLGLAAYNYFRTDHGRYMRDVVILKIPITGSMLIKSAMSRFASIFSILLSSGVTVLDSMKVLSGTMTNAAILVEFDRIIKLLEEGRGISEPLKSAQYFTPMVTNMVAIGEESGNLEEILDEISDHYDSELNYDIKKLTEALGPLLTIGLALVVGFFAFAIFLPMWDMINMVR